MQFLGNRNELEVHDLTREDPRCQISKIKPEHKVWFSSLPEAHRAGFDNCNWCIGDSKR